MSKNNIGCVIIVDKNHVTKPLGIITERDVVRLLGTLNQILTDTPLGNIMSRPLITISKDSSIKDAIQTMQRKNIPKR